MDALIATLLVWIGTYSAHDTSSIIHPDVQLLSPREMTEEYYRDSGIAPPESGIDYRINALYNSVDAENGIIFLLDPFADDAIKVAAAGFLEEKSGRTGELSEPSPLEDPTFQEQLLHELVHHVQQQTGAYESFPCPVFGEKEAYLLGGEFLKHKGVQDPMPNRRVFAHVYSRC